VEDRPPDRRETRTLVRGAVVIVAAGAAFVTERLVGHRNGIDFDVYRAAGRAVVHGKSLYSPWMATQMGYRLPFTYPPAAALFAVPFGLVPRTLAFVTWDVVSVAALAGVVRRAAGPLLARYDARRAGALALTLLVALATSPVHNDLLFGQVGIVLMALCIADCVATTTRWPRGAGIGVATAIKLVPGIFVVYFWLTGRRREARTAALTAVLVTVAALPVRWDDSVEFWTSRFFDNSRVGDNAYFSNQSLNGMLRRALGGDVKPLWLVLAAVVLVHGLYQANRAYRQGHELLAVTVTALGAALASPVSWVHHLVWVVPALALLIGDGRDRRRTAVVLALAFVFTLRLPYLGNALPDRFPYAVLGGALKSLYGVICLALLVGLPRLLPLPRPGGRPRPTPAAPAAS
jgi:alpha-1,2-mannosyltransferase